MMTMKYTDIKKNGWSTDMCYNMNNLDDIMLNERNSYKDHILCDYLYEMPRTAKSRGWRSLAAQDWEGGYRSCRETTKKYGLSFRVIKMF